MAYGATPTERVSTPAAEPVRWDVFHRDDGRKLGTVEAQHAYTAKNEGERAFNVARDLLIVERAKEDR